MFQIAMPSYVTFIQVLRMERDLDMDIPADIGVLYDEYLCDDK